MARGGRDLPKESGELGERDALAVVVLLRALVAPDGLLLLPELAVAPGHRAPHSRVVRAQRRCLAGGRRGSGPREPLCIVGWRSGRCSRLAVVEERVKVHCEDLIRLSQAIPRAVVFWIDVDRVAVRVDRRRRILELDVLVAHQGPRRQKVPVELQRAPKVEDGLLMLRLKGVIIADDAAGLRPILVNVDARVRQRGERALRLLDV